MPIFLRLPTLLTAALALPAQYPLPSHNEPLRNTFIVATESVVDTASGIKPGASRAVSEAELQHLKTLTDNLATLAETDREKEIVATANDLQFAVTSCQLQARAGTPTDACQTQVDHARLRVMDALGKHKNGDTWVDGPPARP